MSSYKKVKGDRISPPAAEQALFRRKKAVAPRLLAYGFLEGEGRYHYTTALLDGQFRMTVDISKAGEVRTRVIDAAAEEEYVLHRATGAVGAFVGMVKDAYEGVLRDISERCFEPDVFQSEQAKQVIRYVLDAYGDELEYLWRKFPDNAVVRRKDNQKWYGAILTVSRRKLGFASDEPVEILDLRMRPEDIERLVDGINYLPGYHMNKKHWISICLDGTLEMEELRARIDESYRLAAR